MHGGVMRGGLPPLSAGAVEEVERFKAHEDEVLRRQLYARWVAEGAGPELSAQQASEAVGRARHELAQAPVKRGAGLTLRQHLGLVLVGLAGAFLVALVADERDWLRASAVVCAALAVACLLPARRSRRRRPDSST